MKTLAILISLITLFPAQSHSQKLDGIVKIGILCSVKSVNVSCENEYYMYDMDQGKRIDLDHRNIFLVKPGDTGIYINNTLVNSSSIRLTSKSDGTHIKIDGKRYRDSIIIQRNKNSKTLTIINELGIENYVYGILSREVSNKWDIESLKAQAVISRTYVLTNRKRHLKDGFDCCNTVHCQVYGGVEDEKPETDKAVDLTKCEVLTYNGKLTNTLFHACCAGYTEDPRHVWNDFEYTPEYLSGVRCKYCKSSPHYNWSSTVKEDYLIRKLAKSGIENIKSIKSIKYLGKYDSGRTKYILIKYNNSWGESLEKQIQSSKFRMMIDPWVIKSTNFTDIYLDDNDNFIFKGHGWGHGVGMCQWGAKGMAEHGYDYNEILEHYYPGTKIEKWNY